MNDFRYSPKGLVDDDDDDDDELEIMARREMDEDDAIDISTRPPRLPRPASSEQSSRPPTFGRHSPGTPAPALAAPPTLPPAAAALPQRGMASSPPFVPSPSTSPPPPFAGTATSSGSTAGGGSSGGGPPAPPGGAPRKRSASRNRPPEVSHQHRKEKRDFIVDCIINDEVPSRTATPRGISTPRGAGLPRSASRGPSRGPAPPGGARARGASCQAPPAGLDLPCGGGPAPTPGGSRPHRSAAAGAAAMGVGRAGGGGGVLPASPRQKGMRAINLLDAPSRPEEKSHVSSLPQLGAKTSKHHRSQHGLVPSGSQSARSWRGKAALSVYA